MFCRFLIWYPIFWEKTNKNALYWSREHYFYVSQWRRGRLKDKGSNLILQLLWDHEYYSGPQEIEPATYNSTVKRDGPARWNNDFF